MYQPAIAYELPTTKGNGMTRTLAGCGKYVVLSNAKDLGWGRPASP